MAIGKDVRAGRSYVELRLQDDKFRKGVLAAQKRIQALGTFVRGAGLRTMAVGAGLVAPFAAAIKVFSGFSSSMSEVRAITNATGDDYAKLEAKARELGASTSFSASEAAQGMKYLGMAGFNTQQILAGIPAVLELARAGGIGLAEAADIASDVGSAFGLTADEIQRVADVMAVTASSANTSISMMGETLKYAAPLAKAAGQSIEDTSTAIGIMGNSGIKGTMAGTDLALILKQLGTSKDLAKIAVQDGKIRSVTEAMKDLGEQTRDMSDADRLAYFSKHFGRAAKSAIILADAGDAMDDLSTKIANAEGAAAKMAVIMGDNLSGDWKGFMSAVEGAAIGVAEALVEPLRAAVTWGTKLMRWIGDFISENQGLVKILAAVAGGVVVFGAAMVAAAPLLTALATTLGMVATVGPLLASAFASLAGFAMSALPPVLAIAAGIAAIGAPLYMLIQYTESGAEAFTWLKQAAGVAFGFVAQRAKWAITAIRLYFSPVTSLFTGMLADITEAFGVIKQALVDGDLGSAAKVFWATLKLTWNRGVNAVALIWSEFKTLFLLGTNDMVLGFARSFVSGVSGAISQTVIAAHNIWTGLKEAWFLVSDAIQEGWSRMMIGIWKGIHQIELMWIRLKHMLSNPLQMFALDKPSWKVEQRRGEQENEIQQMEQDARRNRAGERNAYFAQQDQERRDFRGRWEGFGSGLTQGIEDTAAGNRVAIERQRQEAIQQASDDMDAARADWSQAVDEAYAAGLDADYQEAMKEALKAADTSGQVSSDDPVDGVNAALDDAEQNVSTRGTFSAIEAMLGLGADDAADRTADATESMDKKMDQLIQAAQDGGLAFD